MGRHEAIQETQCEIMYCMYVGRGEGWWSTRSCMTTYDGYLCTNLNLMAGHCKVVGRMAGCGPRARLRLVNERASKLETRPSSDQAENWGTLVL